MANRSAHKQVSKQGRHESDPLLQHGAVTKRVHRYDGMVSNRNFRTSDSVALDVTCESTYALCK